MARTTATTAEEVRYLFAIKTNQKALSIMVNSKDARKYGCVAGAVWYMSWPPCLRTNSERTENIYLKKRI